MSSIRRHNAENQIRAKAEKSLKSSLTYCLVARSLSRDPGHHWRVPKNVVEARQIPECGWAIDWEENALVETGTWILVDRKPGTKPVLFLWRLYVKALGSYPAQILSKPICVARGHIQRPYMDLDPENLYGAVWRLELIRFLFVKVAAKGFILGTTDISNAYFYGDLDEALKIKQPQNASGSSFFSGKFCFLLKSVYGAKQAGQIWGSLMHRQLVRCASSSLLEKPVYISLDKRVESQR